MKLILSEEENIVIDVLDEGLWQNIGSWLLGKNRKGQAKPEKVAKVVEFLVNNLRSYISSRGSEEFLDAASKEFSTLTNKLNMDVLSRKNRDEVKLGLMRNIKNEGQRRHVIIFFTNLLNNMIKRDFDMTNEREKKLFEALQKRRAAKRVIKERIEAVKLLESKVKQYSDIPVIKSQRMIMEFFGPFKKLGVADLEKKVDAQDKPNKTVQNLEKSGADNKGILAQMKQISQLEKAVKKVSLGNVVEAGANLDSYVDGLVELYGMLKRTEDMEIRAQGKELFGRAAATMKGMTQALQGALKQLTKQVPTFTSIYATADAHDMAARQAQIIQSPMQRLKGLGQALAGGTGGGPAAKTAAIRNEAMKPEVKKEKKKLSTDPSVVKKNKK